MSTATTTAVRRLLTDACEAYRGLPEADGLQDVLDGWDGPLRVAFAGRVKAGKSTLLNALVGERLAATDATECTRIVTSYVNGPATRAWAYPFDAEPVQVPFLRVGGQTRIELGDLAADGVAQLVVETPNRRLERLTLVDTPGIGSVRREVSARTDTFLLDDGSGADAVLYLMRHLHTADVGFLQSMSDEQEAGVSPVNAVGILSRADEIAGGREDSLEVAARIAQTYSADPRVRSLVQTVVSVSGLLALASTGLQERQHAAVATLAAAPTSLLLSADRLLDALPEHGPSREVRAELLEVLGLFGVRLCVSLVRLGSAADAATLAGALRRLSGLEDVRGLLLERFVARATVLKMRRAVRTVEAALAARPVEAAGVLRRRVEEVLASAHELVELRLLDDLRTGELQLGDDAAALDAERLLGVDGDTPHERLGLDPAVPDEEVRAAAIEALRRWHRRAASPLATPDLRRTAELVARSCEGIVAGMPAASLP
ncbi:dynamin family protein [Cellulomonas sp. P5_C5]